MKFKNMKKVLAVTLSATMFMATSMTALAEDATDPGATTTDPAQTSSSGNVEAPIYSYDVLNVVVPTTYAVAFNPDELDVKVNNETTNNTSNKQILSKNYGIINKSSKDKIVTVELQVEDLNTGDNKVTFVDTDAEATGADKDIFAIHLAATPADATEVKIGTTPADKDTLATALADVAMTPATGQDTTLHAGSNHIAFKLDKAEYQLISGKTLELGTTDTNNVADLFEVKSLAGAGKGITGFTFTGAMNKKADWTKLQNKIKITAIYTNKTAAGTEPPTTGTGAMVPPSAAPTFSCNAVGVITYSAGIGTEAFKELKDITAPWQDSPLSLKASTTVNTAESKITVASNMLGGWAKAGIDPIATITYEDQAGTEQTATVTLKTH